MDFYEQELEDNQVRLIHGTCKAFKFIFCELDLGPLKSKTGLANGGSQMVKT